MTILMPYSILCIGACNIDGFYCPVGSTSPFMHHCGGDAVYCPGELSAAPIAVQRGFYTADYSSVFPSVVDEDAARTGTAAVPHIDFMYSYSNFSL
jgi:hypothetical protein